jgi:uncharacterized protein YjbJ (UPF0337 family)
MEWSEVEGHWTQLKREVQAQWHLLSEHDLQTIAGRRDALEALIEERYCYPRDMVRQAVEDWLMRKPREAIWPTEPARPAPSGREILLRAARRIRAREPEASGTVQQAR